MTKLEIAKITGLVYCGRDCGCGENSRLWYTQTPSGTPEEWLCANGWTTQDVVREIRRRTRHETRGI
jgi:hypothetical protein